MTTYDNCPPTASHTCGECNRAPCTCGHRKAQHHMGEGWCCAPVSPSRTCACDLYESARRVTSRVEGRGGRP